MFSILAGSVARTAVNTAANVISNPATRSMIKPAIKSFAKTAAVGIAANFAVGVTKSAVSNRYNSDVNHKLHIINRQDDKGIVASAIWYMYDHSDLNSALPECLRRRALLNIKSGFDYAASSLTGTLLIAAGDVAFTFGQVFAGIGLMALGTFQSFSSDSGKEWDFDDKSLTIIYNRYLEVIKGEELRLNVLREEKKESATARSRRRMKRVTDKAARRAEKDKARQAARAAKKSQDSEEARFAKADN